MKKKIFKIIDVLIDEYNDIPFRTQQDKRHWETVNEILEFDEAEE